MKFDEQIAAHSRERDRRASSIRRALMSAALDYRNRRCKRQTLTWLSVPNVNLST
jgi:hypothetical protein